MDHHTLTGVTGEDCCDRSSDSQVQLVISHMIAWLRTRPANFSNAKVSTDPMRRMARVFLYLSELLLPTHVRPTGATWDLLRKSAVTRCAGPLCCAGDSHCVESET